MSEWAGFLDIPPLLQEKIITKLEWKSYFRIQQTSKYLFELVRKSPNVRIFVPGEYFIRCSKENGSTRFFIQRWLEPTCKLPYGVRFETLCIRYDIIGQQLIALCNVLKDHRITSNYVKTSSSFLTKEEYELLMRTLEISHVKLDNCQANLYDALFQMETLKKINLDLYTESESIIPEITRLLSLAEGFQLTWHSSSQLQDDEFFSKITRILEILDSNQFQHLREFKFHADHSRAGIPTSEECLEILKGFVSPLSRPQLIKGFGGMQQLMEFRIRDSQSLCKVTLSQFFVEIEYKL